MFLTRTIENYPVIVTKYTLLISFSLFCPDQSTSDSVSVPKPTLLMKLSDLFQCFRPDRSGQTVQTQIGLLLEEQSDQGLHCLQFPLHLLDALLEGKAILFNFKVITANFRVSEI